MALLEDFVHNAGLVIAADAHMSIDKTGMFLRRLRPAASFHIQINTFRRAVEYDAVLLPYDDLLADGTKIIK